MSFRETIPSIADVSGELDFEPKLVHPLDQVRAIVIHHTVGHPTLDGALQTYRDLKNPAQFFIDPSGKIYQTLPAGKTGQQILTKGPFSNNNTIGIEVSAEDDADILPIQIEAAKSLFQYLTADPAASGWGATGSPRTRSTGMASSTCI